MHARAQLRYADVLYTMGKPDHVRAARTYYSAALQLSEGQNLRALWGVCATSAALAPGGDAAGAALSPRKPAAGPPLAAGHNAAAPELGELAAQQLQQRYVAECPAKLPFVQAALRGMGLLK